MNKKNNSLKRSNCQVKCFPFKIITDWFNTYQASQNILIDSVFIMNLVGKSKRKKTTPLKRV